MNITRCLSLLRQGRIPIAHYNGIKTCCNIGNLHVFKQNDENKQQLRNVSTCEVKSVQKEESMIYKVLKKIPWFLLTINKTRIRAAAYLLYEEIADTINYNAFFDDFDLPDTFYSWFVITELHIWMLSVRAMADGEEGKLLRNCLLESLWDDVAQRVKKLGVSNSSAIREQILELSEQLQAALIAYDEGLQSSDIVLAGALWRRFYQSENVELQHLEELVKYIRKHITLLDNTPGNKLYQEKTANWEPIVK